MKKRQPRTGWLHFQTRSSRRHGTGAEGTRSASILGSLASVAHGHQLCGELPVHRHYLDRPPSPYAVRRASDARIDMDQLRPSFHGVAPALCDRMDCAHPACLIPCSVLRRVFVCIDVAYNVFEHQVLAHADATQVSARMRRMARRRLLVVLASFTTAMLVAIAARRLRSHMRRPDPPLAARSPCQSAVT